MYEEPLVRKISIVIPQPLYKRLDSLFERGERNRVLNRVIEWVCEKIETHGKEALIVLLREENFDSLVALHKGKEKK